MKRFPLLAAVLLCGSVQAEPFTAEHLVRLDRVGAPALSPDGARVVYAVRETDMEADTGRYDLFLSEVAGGEARRLTRHEANDTAPAWSADGQSVYFLSRRGDATQVWRIAMSGGEAHPVTDLPLDVGTFRLSADGRTLIVTLSVYPDCTDLACTVERDKAAAGRKTTGVAYDHLFMRHWDHWLDEKRSRLFALRLGDDGRAAGAPVLLAANVDADVPGRPFGGVEDYAIGPDNASVYFTARLRDAQEAWSTNYDLYRAPLDGDGPAVNLTESNPAWDTQPVFSPDGRQLAYLAMSRPGFEADRFRVLLRDLASGETREVAPGWDHSPSSIAFAPDGGALYANAQDRGRKTLWRLPLDGAPQRVAADGTISAFEVHAKGIVYARDTLASPSELFWLPAGADAARRVTDFSGPQLAGVELGDYEQFTFAGAGGATVHGYVVRPAGFEPGKRYPVAFLVHGGPQGSFGDHFHFRWNPQTYAGQGFAAVMIDFHGSTGYGQAFTDSISGDWGGKPLEDLQLGLAAAVEKYAFLDGERVCALGASYGGFMINWIAGQWPDRFRCLVNHDGVFDQRSMYYTTEELWFPEWDQKGTPFENPENYERFNPAVHVDEWRTPMLVVHGELDYRVPVTQGIAAFTALQRRGIPSRFLYFPDENHWVLKPHNSLQWHAEVNTWLHRWLNEENTP
jgi:dipeptidyl aminopeptidase/acylaminoacyl peptidase